MIYPGSNFLLEHKQKRIKFDGELKQITLPDHRVYRRGEGVYYPSVTTILQYMPKNKFFEQWIKDVGHNADLIMRRAGEEGTAVHNAAEELIKGGEVQWMDDYGKAKYSLLVWQMINKFVDAWKTMAPEVIATEEFTFSDVHKYAGTADIIARIGDEVWLLDIKTSNSLHKSHELQLSAYAKAWEEMYGQKIDRTGIIWLKSTKRTASSKDGAFQGKGWELKVVDNIDENFELFQLIYKLYLLEHPADEPSFQTYPLSVKL